MELTLKDIKELVGAEENAYPFNVGSCYYIRTITYHLTGRVKRITGKFLELDDAAWVADSGRFQQAIIGGALDEVEPVGDAIVNTDSIVDAFPWVHPLPKDQK